MYRNGLFVLCLLTAFSCTPKNKEIKTAPPNTQGSEQVKTEAPPINIKPLPIKPKLLSELENLQKTNHELSINLSFDHVPIQKAILAVAKAAKFNAIVPPDIKGTVTLELQSKSLEDCLNSLLKPLGYSFKLDGKNIYVITKETKVFQINIPQVNRKFSSSMQATIGGNSTNTTSGSSGSATMSLSNSYSSTFWKDIESAIKTIIKTDEGATYSLEPLTGTIVVTAKPATIQKVENFVKTINRETEKQVLIEAKIVEVRLDKNNQTGINWKYITFNHFLGSGGEYTTLTVNSGSPESLPFQLSVVKTNNNFSAILGVLSRFGKVNVLSSPRILTMNGQPAMIKVGKDYILIYKTQTVSTTTAGTATATTLTTESVTTDSIITEGVVLNIVPRVDNEGNVILNITPAISSLETPLISGTTGTTEDFINKVYAVNIRQLNTVIKAKSGQTIILGGLIAKLKSKDREGVPILQDIPLIGNAFSSTTETSSKTELVIMLTPYVEK